MGTIGIVQPGAQDEQGARMRAVSSGVSAPEHEPHGGNLSTAQRWSAIFAELGHDVLVGSSWSGEKLDVLVALHARKSHASIRRFRNAQPTTPVVVAATGTDIYGDAPQGDEVKASFEIATRIVVLQPLAVEALPETERWKAHVIYQSMPRLPGRRSPTWDPKQAFDVAFLANTRPVKDPLTALRAARLLGPESRVRVLHLGGVLDEALAAELSAGSESCAAFSSLGALSRAEALGVLGRSQLALSTSRHEGGANVVTEALAYGVPVLATNIPGSVGLLGKNYPGLFPVGDARELSRLLERAASDEAFYGTLCTSCNERASITDPERELASWKALLGEI